MISRGKLKGRNLFSKCETESLTLCLCWIRTTNKVVLLNYNNFKFCHLNLEQPSRNIRGELRPAQGWFYWCVAWSRALSPFLFPEGHFHRYRNLFLECLFSPFLSYVLTFIMAQRSSPVHFNYIIDSAFIHRGVLAFWINKPLGIEEEKSKP
jgi:hypothetical protein